MPEKVSAPATTATTSPAAAPAPGAGAAATAGDVLAVRGSGSVAVAALMNAVTTNFNRVEPQAAVTYDAVGSLQGAMTGTYPVWPSPPSAGSSLARLFCRTSFSCGPKMELYFRTCEHGQPKPACLRLYKLLTWMGRGLMRDVHRAGVYIPRLELIMRQFESAWAITRSCCTA